MTTPKIFTLTQNKKEDNTNKDLFEVKNILIEEFEKTKELIINLVRHLDSVENNYNVINNEIEKRKS